jgi:hypothetical protein
VKAWSGLHPKLICRGRFAGFAKPPVITQLRLARPLAEDHRQRWERRRGQGKLSPGRIRRDFSRLAAMAGAGPRAAAAPRATPQRHQESCLTSRNGLKRKKVVWLFHPAWVMPILLASSTCGSTAWRSVARPYQRTKRNP